MDVLTCLFAVNKSLLNSSSGHVVTKTSTDFVPAHQLSIDVVASEMLPRGSQDYTSRLSMPVIRGGINSNISDILEASGYGTETDIRVDDDYRFVHLFFVFLSLS